jgi:hypothetical protein
MTSSNRTLLLEDLAVPYVVRVTSVKEPGGWLRRAEYPDFLVASSSRTAR